MKKSNIYCIPTPYHVCNTSVRSCSKCFTWSIINTPNEHMKQALAHLKDEEIDGLSESPHVIVLGSVQLTIVPKLFRLKFMHFF